MEKSKPGRNWRVLLTEVGIVVLGVGLALAAQQAADWLRWQSEVKVARQAIHAEMALNNTRYFTRRIAIAPCMERQLNEADDILTDLEEKRPPAKFTNFVMGSGGLLNVSEWQNQRASQVLTHFPHGELAAMSPYYDFIPTFDSWNIIEGEAWAKLSVLQKPPAGFTTSDIIQLRGSLAQARRMNGLVVLNAQRQINTSKQLGLEVSPVDPEIVRQFCTMTTEQIQRLRATQLAR